MSKSLGIFCRLGSDMVTLPVAVCVVLIPCILSMSPRPRHVRASRWRGNTTLDKAMLIRLHSNTRPGRACSTRNFSRISFEVLNEFFLELPPFPRLDGPRVLRAPAAIGAVTSPDGGSLSSTKRT